MESFREVISDERASHNGNQHKTAGEDALAALFGHFPTIAEVEEHMIAEAMRMSQGNQGMAANLLGVSRQTLNKRLQIKK